MDYTGFRYLPGRADLTLMKLPESLKTPDKGVAILRMLALDR